jgi:hypothetical protein
MSGVPHTASVWRQGGKIAQKVGLRLFAQKVGLSFFSSWLILTQHVRFWRMHNITHKSQMSYVCAIVHAHAYIHMHPPPISSKTHSWFLQMTTHETHVYHPHDFKVFKKRLKLKTHGFCCECSRYIQLLLRMLTLKTHGYCCECSRYIHVHTAWF